MNKNNMYLKMTEELKKVNVKCSCGHSINITNRYKRIICRWCGKMVYLHEEDKKRNEFKVEMRRLLNERTIY